MIFDGISHFQRKPFNHYNDKRIVFHVSAFDLKMIE